MKVLGVSLLALAFLTSSAFANSNFGLSFNGKSNVTQGSDYGYDKNAQLNRTNNPKNIRGKNMNVKKSGTPIKSNTHEGSKIQNADLKLVSKWDKTFPQSDKVKHHKVIFVNHFGITLAADLYEPLGDAQNLPAIAVSDPFGADKEQSSGLYAKTMAEKGYVTIAFDPSFTGESSGEPRFIASSDLNTEDFEAAVDFLSNYSRVDPEKIAIIGICGWGGFALKTAAIDPRVKETIAVTTYDMTRVTANGYNDKEDSKEARDAKRLAMSAQRTLDFKNGQYKIAPTNPDELPADAPQFIKEYFDYYKTPKVE